MAADDGTVGGIGEHGTSHSVITSHQSVMRIFDLYRNTTNPVTRELKELNTETLCTKGIYERFAHFMGYVYRIPTGSRGAGSPLLMDTGTTYFSTFMNLAKRHITDNHASPDAAVFFTCNDHAIHSPNPTWFRGVKRNLERALFLANAEAGNRIRRNVTPVGHTDVKRMVQAYSASGHFEEAALRKFAILTLYRAGGRAAELKFMTWDNLQWDSTFHCVFTDWLCPKTSKTILLPFLVGSNRLNCWYLALADFMTMCGHTSLFWGDNHGNWIYNALRHATQPGTTLGNYMKAVLPVALGGMVKYKDVALVSVSPDIAAGMCVLSRGSVIYNVHL